MEAIPATRRAGGAFQNPSSLLLGTLIAIHVAFGGLVSMNAANFGQESDLARFRQIAAHPGVPYRDFPVEYAPIETLIIEGVAGSGSASTLLLVAWVSLACDLAAFAAVVVGWGRRAGLAYLIFGLPLAPLLYLRLDLVPVALAAWGLALVAREHDMSGGSLMALGTLTKLWPLVLVPALFAPRDRKALGWYAGVLGLGVAAWVTVSGGFQGIEQVVTFRGVTGWEFESTVGVVVWVLTGGPLRWESGALRVGSLSGWSIALAAALAVCLAAIWWRARRFGGSVAGGPALAAVGALVALSPVFSLQYASWLLPWAAIASVDEQTRTLAWTAFVAILLCLLVFVYRVLGFPHAGIWYEQMVLVARDGLCLSLPVLWLLRSRAQLDLDRGGKLGASVPRAPLVGGGGFEPP